MTGPEVLDIARDALWTTVKIAAPTMLVGLAVGLVVALFQALTQIQEQTLAFIPKIIAVFVAILIFGPWMLRIMVEYLTNLLVNLPSYIS